MNADYPSVVLLAQGDLLGTNLYAYCGNKPVMGYDPTGYASFIGFGLQIELNLGPITGGIEFVWYTDKRVTRSNNAYTYVYGGLTLGTNIMDILDDIIETPQLILKPRKLLKSGLSICVFAIFGYSNFRSPYDYLGGFTGSSITAWHIKTYTSWSNTCFTVGLGVSTSAFDFEMSKTSYRFVNLRGLLLRGLYKFISPIAQNIR